MHWCKLGERDLFGVGSGLLQQKGARVIGVRKAYFETFFPTRDKYLSSFFLNIFLTNFFLKLKKAFFADDPGRNERQLIDEWRASRISLGSAMCLWPRKAGTCCIWCLRRFRGVKPSWNGNYVGFEGPAYLGALLELEAALAPWLAWWHCRWWRISILSVSGEGRLEWRFWWAQIASRKKISNIITFWDSNFILDA